MNSQNYMLVQFACLDPVTLTVLRITDEKVSRDCVTRLRRSIKKDKNLDRLMASSMSIPEILLDRFDERFALTCYLIINVRVHPFTVDDFTWRNLPPRRRKARKNCPQCCYHARSQHRTSDKQRFRRNDLKSPLRKHCT